MKCEIWTSEYYLLVKANNDASTKLKIAGEQQCQLLQGKPRGAKINRPAHSRRRSTLFIKKYIKNNQEQTDFIICLIHNGKMKK